MSEISSSAWIAATLLGPSFRSRSNHWANSAAALSTLPLDETQWNTRWVRLLLDSSSHHNLNHPFYRLAPKEALVLVLLLKPRWNYAQISALLDLDAEAAAWRARLKLSEGLGLPFPSGPGRLTPGCPEYQPQSPWTQRHLDKLLGASEKLFLEQHLQRCSNCSEALTRARALYFGIYERLPWSEIEPLALEIDELLRVARSGTALRGRSARIRLLLSLAGVLVLALLWVAIR